MAERGAEPEMGKAKLASGRSPDWAFMETFTVPDYDSDEDYLWRLRIIQTPWFGLYLHRFLTPDPRPTLHDHPWPFISVVLRGGYDEQRRPVHTVLPGERERDGAIHRVFYSRRRRVRFLNVMPMAALHYIERLHRVPTWTLMLVGRRQRVWGYLDRSGDWTRFDEHEFNSAFEAALERRAAR